MTGPTVFVVSHEERTRAQIKSLLESVGLPVKEFADPIQFLTAAPDGEVACLLMQLSEPGNGGLDLQRQINDKQLDLPAIVMADAGDVSAAVEAMKNGAFDFIEMPFNEQRLLDCVQSALSQDRARRQADNYRHSLKKRFETLTAREKEVMIRVVQGMPNRLIAEDLDVSPKTVEVHRSKVMEKMQAGSLSELISISVTIQILSEFVDHTE